MRANRPTIWHTLPAALLLLLVAACSRHEERLRQLELLEARNSADSMMTDNALAEALASYFDDGGTPNERMRAHYILARTYADLGETPAALQAFLDAADAADTTAADCDWAKLSRVHAQSAIIYRQQVQPRSLLNELRMAQLFAQRGSDTVMAIECYAQMAEAYSLMHRPDSVIIIRENASRMFKEIHREEEAARVLGPAITASLQLNDTSRARRFIDIYEQSSEVIDENRNLRKGRLTYYYIKAKYYLAVNKIDSAEIQLRSLQRRGFTLNHQIAASKGLQELYEQLGVSDSIAKYASLGYQLNDSAYSLAEMENIQRLKASYDYQRNKDLAEKKIAAADKLRFWLLLTLSITVFLLMAAALFVLNYRKEKKLKKQKYEQCLDELEKAQIRQMELLSENEASGKVINMLRDELAALKQRVENFKLKQPANPREIDRKLQNSAVVERLKSYLAENPPLEATIADMKELRSLLNEIIPTFYESLNKEGRILRPIEYDICVLIRSKFSPAEISKLTNRSDSYIANTRRRVFEKIYGQKGHPSDLDAVIMKLY